MENMKVQVKVQDTNNELNHDTTKKRKEEDIVYIYSSDDDMGIVFYDRTPRDSSQELSGYVGDGVFLFENFTTASWGEDVNGSKFAYSIDGYAIVSSKKVKYKPDSDLNVHTFIVTPDCLDDIKEQISSSSDELIKIDLHSKIITKDEALNLNPSRKLDDDNYNAFDTIKKSAR